jgi:tetratricopeptide (TPR) repeat protein
MKKIIELFNKKNSRKILKQLTNIFVGVVLVAALGVSFFFYTKVFSLKPPETEIKTMHDAQFFAFIRESRNLALHMRFEEAEKKLRMAIDQSPNPKLKLSAALAMGEALMIHSRQKEHPYALMAMRYLKGVLDVKDELTEEEQRRAYDALLETFAIQKDMSGYLKYFPAAIQVRRSDGERIDLYEKSIDLFMKHGSYEQTMKLLEQAKELFRTAGRYNFIILSELRAKEKAFWDEKWFKEYSAPFRAGESEKEIKTTLLDDTVRSYQKVAQQADREIKAECLFRIGRLLANAGDYQNAQKYIQEFLDSNPSSYADEAMLILMRLGRLQDNLRMTLENAFAYINRYWVNDKSYEELLKAITMAEEKYNYADAYKLANNIIQLPVCKKRELFHAYAARIANRLGLDNEAAWHYGQYLQSIPDNRQLATFLKTMADICIERNDLVNADRWLNEYLAKTPFTKDSEDSDQILYRLCQIRIKNNAPIADIYFVGMLTAEMSPTGRKTLDVLLAVAKKMEEAGVYQLAEAQYNKIALLKYGATIEGENEDADVSRIVSQATLGKARCLLFKGDLVKADHLFREICRIYKDGPVRAEAAYWWGTMAVADDQLEEASRRFNMVKRSDLSNELAARYDFEVSLIEIQRHGKTSYTLAALFANLASLPPDDRHKYASKAFAAYFKRMEEINDISGMKALLEYVAKSPYAENIPLKDYYFRMAYKMLKDQQITGVVRNALLSGERPSFTSAEITQIQQKAADIKEVLTKNL